MQFAQRTFDFPMVTTQPHLEVANTFASGVNRGNPDIYREQRFEVIDNFTHNRQQAHHQLRRQFRSRAEPRNVPALLSF